MAERTAHAVDYVVACTLASGSFAEARAAAADDLAAHVARSKALHAGGTLLLAGAFLDRPGEPLRTMVVLTSHEAAEADVEGDPFDAEGLMREWSIRAWANMFA